MGSTLDKLLVGKRIPLGILQINAQPVTINQLLNRSIGSRGAHLQFSPANRCDGFHRETHNFCLTRGFCLELREFFAGNFAVYRQDSFSFETQFSLPDNLPHPRPFQPVPRPHDRERLREPRTKCGRAARLVHYGTSVSPADGFGPSIRVQCRRRAETRCRRYKYLK